MTGAHSSQLEVSLTFQPFVFCCKCLTNDCILVVFSRLVFESPRWLIQKAYLDDARRTLLKIELIDGTATPERTSIIDQIIESEIAVRQASTLTTTVATTLQEREKRRRQSRRVHCCHLFTKFRSSTLVLAYSM